jgi:hypothetical protein
VADSILVIQLVYVSAAAKPFDDAKLRDLLAKARDNNTRAGITGALLHQEGSFLQVLEGPPEAVEPLFAKIGRDPRHLRVTMLARNQIEAANFPDWSMGFVDVKNSARLLPGFRHVGDLTGLVGDTHAIERVIQSFRGGRWRVAA